MEKENNAKRSKAPLFVIVLSLLLIAAGVVLIVTGNNKSFWEKKEPDNKEEQKNEEQKENEEETPNKGMTPSDLTNEEALALIKGYNETMTPEFNNDIQSAEIVGVDENKEKFLVNYTVVNEDGTTSTKQTIISSIEGDRWIDWPGWNVGERDLTVYNFSDYEENIEQPEVGSNEPLIEPELEDYEYSGPSLDE